jgi:hypothetical protein
VSHYEVLGAEASATTKELRQAYLGRARRLHPDRWIDASPKERAEAQRRMQEVNEAWRVLSDPERRKAYDAGASRADGERTATGESTRGFSAAQYQEAWAPEDDVGDDFSVDLTTRLIRSLPWVVVAGALLAIFVFTAYAGGPSGGSGGPVTPACAAYQVQGGSVLPSVCGAQDSIRVVGEVTGDTPCPAGRRVPRADTPSALCLDLPSAAPDSPNPVPAS